MPHAIVVERSVLERVEGFLVWLQEQVDAGKHADEANLVADFVDKVLLPDLTSLKQSDETYNEEIEIPDEIIDATLKSHEADIKKRAKAAALKAIEGALGSGDESDEEEEVSEPQAAEPEVAEPAAQPAKADDVTSRPRSGNGHESKKKRKLNKNEKAVIEAFFLSKNGIIEDEGCTEFHEKEMPADISLWQVTGYVSWCHTMTALAPNSPKYARMILKDPDAYMEWMKKRAKQWGKGSRCYRQWQKLVDNWNL